MSDAFITLVNALSFAGALTRDVAATLHDKNVVTEGLLADVLARDTMNTIDREDIRVALVALTPEQFSVILQALEHDSADQLLERVRNDGGFPSGWDRDA